MTNKKHIAVLLGGSSSERDVSLNSGRAVIDALHTLGHSATAVDPQGDTAQFINTIKTEKPDVIFNALHGTGGEDGTMQKLLDNLRIPYTHSNAETSAKAMNKPLTKIMVGALGVQSPRGAILTEQGIQNHHFTHAFVIKPPCDGSSFGVRIIHNQHDLEKLKQSPWIYGDGALIEEYIPGHELTVGLMGDAHNVRALGVTELKPEKGFYDYSAKYTAGKTNHLLPAPIPANVYEAALDMGRKAYKALGCNGVARIDARWDDSKKDTDGLYFLEINTQPGLTALSLLPEQARYIKMDFATLVQWIVDHPICPE